MQPFINVNPNVSTKAKINLFDFTPQASLNVPKSIQVAKTIQPTTQDNKQAPKTNNLSLQEFGELIKSKHPVYKNKDSIELAQKMLEKYPEYKTTISSGGSINTGIGGVVEGAISQVPKFVSNVAGFVPKKLSQGAGFVGEQFGVSKENNPFYTSGIQDAERLKTFGNQAKEAIKKFGIEVDDTTSQKIGEELTNIAGSTLIAPGFGTAKLKDMGKYSKGALEGAKQMAQYDIGALGEIKPTDVALGAGLGVAIPAIGSVLNSSKSKLQLSGLINPAKLTYIKDILIKEGQKTPDDLVKWMLDRGIKGDKEKIIQILEERAKNSKQAVDEILQTIDNQTKNKYKNSSIDKALEQLKKDFEGVAGMEGKLNEVETLLKNGKYTLSQANQAKRLIDEQYRLYTQAGTETAGIKAEGLRNIRKDIRKFIEDTAGKNGAGDIKLLNNETQVSKALSDAIGRKDNADYVRELLSPFAGPAIGGAIGGAGNIGPFQGDTLGARMGNIIFGALTGKVITSTRLKTNIASILNKLSKKEISALDRYIQSGGKEQLEKSLEDKIGKEIKGLLPAGGQSSYKKPAIITPQTKEAGIIQESKIPLKKTKYGNATINTTNTMNNPINSNVSKDINLNNSDKSLTSNKKLLKPKAKQEIQSKKVLPKKDNRIQNEINKYNTFDEAYNNFRTFKATKIEADEFSKKYGKLDKNGMPTILQKEAFRNFYNETKLSKLNTSNIDEIAKAITTDPTKLAKVKEVIQKYIKEYGENIKNYLGLLADDLADIVGGRSKLLGGEKAKLFDKSRWQEAKDMTKAGKSADEVWQKTGWEKGTDGKWRFEIDDSKAIFKPENLKIKTGISVNGREYSQRTGKLGDILEHSDLYKQYPNSKNINVSISKRPEGGAQFNKGYNDEGWISFNKNSLTDELTQKDKSSLLHEVQHYIQEKEGFAKGGTITPRKDLIEKYELELKNIGDTDIGKTYKKRLQEFDDYWNNEYDKIDGDSLSMNNPKIKELEKKQYIAFQKFKENNKNYVDKIKDLENKILDEKMKGFDGYQHLAGEVEARNVQTRLLKPASERKILRPEKTEDIERSKQIIKKDGGVAMSKSDDLINLKKVDQYYKTKTGNNDVTEIMDRFKKSSIENQQNVMKKINTPKVENKIIKPKENILDTLNPTGGLYVKYNPEIRAKAKLGPNITTLDKTMGVSPDKEIVIYRGAPKSQKGIVPGDFVTTNYDLAKSYTGEGNILEIKVKASDVLDDITEPLGEEYIYRPNPKLPKKD